jgi:hypothetical protein
LNIENVPQTALKVWEHIMIEGLKTHIKNDWKWISKEEHLKHFFIHFNSYMEGNLIDEDTGDTHLSHAFCRLGFILDNDLNGRGANQEVT